MSVTDRQAVKVKATETPHTQLYQAWEVTVVFPIMVVILTVTVLHQFIMPMFIIHLITATNLLIQDWTLTISRVAAAVLVIVMVSGRGCFSRKLFEDLGIRLIVQGMVRVRDHCRHTRTLVQLKCEKMTGTSYRRAADLGTLEM